MRSRLTKFVPAWLRTLEATVHRAWLRLGVRVFCPSSAPSPQWNEHAGRVLLVRYDRLGDMILCTGVLRAIAQAHPKATIDVLTVPENAPALTALPFVNEVILHRRGEWARLPSLLRRLWKGRYDAVIDGLVLRPSVNSYTTMIMVASRARWRIGSADRPNDFVYNVPVKPPVTRWGEHHVEHLARLAAPFGLDGSNADWRPTLVLTRNERDTADAQWRDTAGDGQRILVNLSAGHPERRWPDDRFATMLACLRRLRPDARIIIVALGAERGSAETLAEPVGAKPVVPGVRELFALIAAADLVISPDTAVTHAAAAFRRPTVALLRRREEFAAWVPYRTAGRNVFGDDEVTLSGLPAARVVAALEDLLGESVPLMVEPEARQTAPSRVNSRGAGESATDALVAAP